MKEHLNDMLVGGRPMTKEELLEIIDKITY